MAGMQHASLKRNLRYVPVNEKERKRYRLDLRPQAGRPLFTVGETRVIEDWLEVPIGGGWIAAYRIAHSGDPETPQTRILEVRIFPDEPKRPIAGEWSAKVRGGRARVRTAFSFERLRRGVTEKSFNAALQATRSNAEERNALGAFGYPAKQRMGSGDEGRGAGRPGLSRSFYALVAVRYHEIEHDPDRDPGTSSRRTLKQRYYPKASLDAIGKWLTTARKQGLLTNVNRGSRGSMATGVAYALAGKAR